MKGRTWLILLLANMAMMLLAINTGVTMSTFTDAEDSSDNTLRAIANWYDFAWHWRKPITINNGGGALTDFQVKVTVNTQELISAGKMQSNGEDIRFTQSDGTTLISYWIESGISTTSTVIWVKVPSIPAGNSTIYMYYGNPNASSTSSGADTFIEFFDKDSTAGWNQTNITVETSGDFLRFYNPTASNTGYAIKTGLTSPSVWNLEARFKNESLGSSDQVIIATLDGDGANRFSYSISPHQSYQNKCGYNDGSEHEIGTNLWTEGTEYIFIHRVDENNSSTGVDYYVCDTSRTVVGSAEDVGFTLGSPTDMDRLAIGDVTNSGVCDAYFRWIFLRQYASPEPSVTGIGAEE